MKSLKKNKVEQYKNLYFCSQLILTTSLIFIISLIFFPYENLIFQINSLRPGEPYQFFTTQYHFYLKVFFCFISISLICIIFFLKNKRTQFLNHIQNFKVEIYFILNKIRSIIRDNLKFEDRLHILILLSFILISIGVRLFFLDRPIFHDEAKTFYAFISKSWIETITNYYVPNNHVFHSILSRFSFLTFGNNEWAIRLPVFFTGCFTVIFCYLSTRSLFNKNIALILTAFTANGIPLVNYSVNARGFILNTLFFLLLLLITKELNKRYNVILYFFSIIIASIGLWTIPAMIMPIFFIFYWFLLSGNLKSLVDRSLKSFSAFFLIGILTFFFYSPIILRATNIKILMSIKPMSFSTISGLLPHQLFVYWEFFTTGYSQNIKFIIVALLIIGANYHLKHKKSRDLFSSLLLTIFSIFFILKIIPPDRSLLFLYPVFWIYVSTGIYTILLLITKIINKDINHISNYLSIIIFCYTFVLCIENGATIGRYQDQTCIEAEKIILDIKDELKINQKVIASSPLAGPLRYYLLKNNIPEDVFFWHVKGKDKSLLTKSNKIFIITRNTRTSLESYGYDPSSSIQGFSDPKLWKEYKDNTKVYVIEKLL